ncbi:methyl-coenzyme M reductase I operon protein C [Candidatus Methanoperedens nitroreducens]|uniref:Methyl-coenzyme M reductase I operon protein C n=1 Tax=Candidatus Methanoperedens nitratireducens TaxID=1392998 RepID=A0A062V7E5_9EURY|nr:methyl-coenzyme M reductase I operon protein C [Candidatus Methanoperedens nitroreducens]
MFGRETQLVDCREAMGLGRGGGLAQRGTLSEAARPDVVAIAMTPGRRHITKPVCEITQGLRREGIQVSVLVLEAGAGIPMDEVGSSTSSRGYGASFGLTAKEIEQIARHRLVLLHMGNVNSHIIFKTKKILKYINIPAVIACEYPIDFEDFAKAGIRTKFVRPKNPETEGTVVAIVSGITRGETCSRIKLNELAKNIRYVLSTKAEETHAVRSDLLISEGLLAPDEEPGGE